MKSALLLVTALGCLGCKAKPEPQPRSKDGSGSAVTVPAGSAGAASSTSFDVLPRAELNRWAVRTNLPLYWIADADDDKAVDPDEVASLLFYPTSGTPAAKWVEGGKLTPAFTTAYATIVAASRAAPPDPSTDEGKRQLLIGRDLDQGRTTLVRSDLTALSADDKAFVGHMMKIGSLVDELYDLQNGSAALISKLPADAASHSAFRRNRGPKCVGPATENDPLCSAIPGAPKPIFDLYPPELQGEDKFCAKLEARKDAKELLHAHFSVIRGSGDDLKAVPYTEAYKPQMSAIARELEAAADAMKDPAEAALVTYLRAAAKSFETNDWIPADEAWAKMTVDNSKWYVRIAPDEVYWEPCSQKAGVHLTFARINQASKAWQQKLVPVQQEMEAAIAARAGAPYTARKVTFHLPDFIDIIINAGDDRDALGATIGQSLPNWGPVANEGRGRTVAMTNINTDLDSMAARRAQAESLLDAASMKTYASSPEPSLLNTILHEACHNLGPAHEYKVGGKAAGEVFSGPIASMMEELKAQTGALFLVEFLRAKKLIPDALAANTYADGLVWAFGHTSQGMYTGSKERKTYPNLAAIQIGFLLEKGALTWDPKAMAANGKDTGAFTIHRDKLIPAVQEMMSTAAGIKARGDRKAAEELIKKYVDASTVVPHELIRERFGRHPKPSFVYAVAL
ncbi:MAG: hypothetical protein H0T89_07045 [Deltaproteobacteria bacterium]|nr:hypothetical protein [Deltaproteobacteria bacterium]MDQ3300946.1 hypothetical protein [Myxococcota bacterium]